METAADRAAWLADRLRGIGGSDIAHVFSDRPEHCARRLAYEKLEAPPDFPEDLDAEEPIRGGRILESFIVTDYRQRTGRGQLVPVANPYIHPTLPFVRANLDAIILDGTRTPADGVFEAKTHTTWLYRKVKREGLKAAHIRQLQWNMLASGRTWGAFGVAERESTLLAALERLLGVPSPRPIEMVYFDAERDDALIAQMIPAAERFWNGIERRELPDPLPDVGDRTDDRCFRCAWRRTCRGASLYGQPNLAEAKIPLEEYSTPELQMAIADVLGAKAQLQTADLEYEAAKQTVIDALGGREAVLALGTKIYHRPVGRSGWDTTGLKLLTPTPLVQIRRPPAGSTDDATAAALRDLRLLGYVVEPVDLKNYQTFNPQGGGRPLKIYPKKD